MSSVTQNSGNSLFTSLLNGVDKPSQVGPVKTPPKEKGFDVKTFDFNSLLLPDTTDLKFVKQPNKGSSATMLNFVDTPIKDTQSKVNNVQHASSSKKIEHATTTAKPKDINTQAVFHKTDIATAEDIDKILTKFHSPHAGKGKEFLEICKKNNINPILMLAIMQQESSFGSSKLKVENQANPFSVHFNQKAPGIKKLRLKDGSLPTLEQSLDSAAKTMNKWSGKSATPLTTAGKHYCETSTWSNLVMAHYRSLLRSY